MTAIRLALIGCGGYAGAHARRLKANPDCRIVALCDTSDVALKRMLETHLTDAAPAPATYHDIPAMLGEAKPDAVVIATPHTLHFEHAMAALEAGCHVLIEKPMVTRAADAHTLAARARELGRIVIVGYNTPCTPEFRYLRALIRGGELGRLELVHGYLAQGWLDGTRGSWRQQPSLSGGGQAYDSGAHLLNSLCWSVESPVAEVYAAIDNLDTPVDINSAMTIRFANGVMASIAIGGNCPANGSHMVYLFDGGRVEIDGWSGSWINLWRGRDRIKYPPITTAPQTPDDNFIDAILGRAEPGTTPENGIIQCELMDLIYESARTGAPARSKEAHQAAVLDTP